MKTNDFKEKVKQVIAQKAGFDAQDLQEDMFFEEDLNLDELEITEILEELEEEFKVELLSKQEEILSIRDLFDLLQEKLE